MSDDFGPSQKRESVRMGVSGHSRELTMAEIAKFNKGMNDFFKRRGMHYVLSIFDWQERIEINDFLWEVVVDTNYF